MHKLLPVSKKRKKAKDLYDFIDLEVSIFLIYSFKPYFQQKIIFDE